MGFFPEQQFGDEARSEHEEHIDPETPGVRGAVRQSQPPRPPGHVPGHSRGKVKAENAAKTEGS